MTADAAVVAENADRVRRQIADAGGDPDRVSILAVTKGFGPDASAAALAAGLVQLGENYAQELAEKAPHVVGAPEWHFIGRLQSNKVKLIADLVARWDSVDRSSLVAEIAKRSPGARILIQVNASGEPQKGGCAVPDVADLVALATEAGLAVEGLMTVGVDDDDRATAQAFERVAGLADDLGLTEVSMGMSADLSAAIRAGSTQVRVGRALFGPRPTVAR
ncbi:YggS family pyridoxal phosphate-dependent enzyme [Actinospongicola halichondriae]|uniref:YggS family pyridoxal phosphate-dependent enzyme n=1 Tax=Actinospongicola halichondriae TaxID=3236844 RepID=UPI003D54962A